MEIVFLPKAEEEAISFMFIRSEDIMIKSQVEDTTFGKSSRF